VEKKTGKGDRQMISRKTNLQKEEVQKALGGGGETRLYSNKLGRLDSWICRRKRRAVGETTSNYRKGRAPLEKAEEAKLFQKHRGRGT